MSLTNPGARDSRRADGRAQSASGPFFTDSSIFGGGVEELRLKSPVELWPPYQMALELNLSCPHATGYGMAMGQDPALVKEITAAVKAAVDIPVVPQLTPNTPNIAEKLPWPLIEGGAECHLCN